MNPIYEYITAEIQRIENWPEVQAKALVDEALESGMSYETITQCLAWCGTDSVIFVAWVNRTWPKGVYL